MAPVLENVFVTSAYLTTLLSPLTKEKDDIKSRTDACNMFDETLCMNAGERSDKDQDDQQQMNANQDHY